MQCNKLYLYNLSNQVPHNASICFRSATEDTTNLSSSASSSDFFRERKDTGPPSRHSSLSEKIFKSPRKASKYILMGKQRSFVTGTLHNYGTIGTRILISARKHIKKIALHRQTVRYEMIEFVQLMLRKKAAFQNTSIAIPIQKFSTIFSKLYLYTKRVPCSRCFRHV